MSYRVGREQFIAVTAGWNGVRVDPDPPGAPPRYDNAGRLLVLKLGGGPIRVAARQAEQAPLMSVAERQPTQMAARSQALYAAHCARCHGYVGKRTPFPDLRRMRPEALAAFDDIVLRGAFAKPAWPASPMSCRRTTRRR